MAEEHGSAGSQEAVRKPRGQDPELILLCLPQPLQRHQHAVERARARQCVRRLAIRARQWHAHQRARSLASRRNDAAAVRAESSKRGDEGRSEAKRRRSRPRHLHASKAESTPPPALPSVATEEDPASGAATASSNPFVRPKIGAPGSDIVTPQVATEEDYGSGHPSNPFIEPKAGDRGEDAVTPAKVESTPPPPPSVTTEPVSPDAKSQFVTFLFEDACRHFGTVLGPNANEAHKDHFHLDMKARRKSNFCE
jgi:hypothetical protein